MASKRSLIKIAAETWVPYTIVTEMHDGNLSISGPMGQVVDIFAKFYNFEYRLVRPPDGLWGAKQPDGQWTGMMGMVDRKEVEFAVGPFTITPERETACDFSRPVHSDNLAILMERPGLQNDVSGFLKPFAYETDALTGYEQHHDSLSDQVRPGGGLATPWLLNQIHQVWLLIVLSTLSVVVSMVFVIRMEERIFNFSTLNLKRKISQWAIQNLTQESSDWIPQHDAGRVLMTTWLLASLVFMTSYGGILTAMLTVPRVTIPIDSLADLVSQNNLPWRLEAGSMMPKFLMESGDPVRQKVVTHVSGTVPDCWSAREAIARGEYAALCDETSMKKSMSWDFSTTGRCHLYIAKEYVFTNAMMAMAFQINSKYLEDADKVIGLVMEAGVLRHWMGSQLTNVSQCLRPPSSDKRDGIKPLNIEAFSGPFVMIILGIGVGLIIFFTEHIHMIVKNKLFED